MTFPLLKDVPIPTIPPASGLIARTLAPVEFRVSRCLLWWNTSFPLRGNVSPLARESKMAKIGLCGVVGLPRPEQGLAIHSHGHVFQSECRPEPVWTDLELKF